MRQRMQVQGAILWQCRQAPISRPAGASARALKQKPSAAALELSSHGRRSLLLCGLLLAQVQRCPASAIAAEEAPGLELVPFVDARYGYKFLRPFQWNKVEKDGAAVLFEDPSKKSNNVGMVVNPVRISSLQSFGTAQDVADRLLAAEKSKASTNSVELLTVESRLLRDSTPIYEIQYMLDSSRGVKRVFSAVTIASRKLYILNLVFDASSPIPPQLQASLDAIAGSLELL